MARYFVRNETQPVVTASPHGLVVDVQDFQFAPAAYAAAGKPVAPGDILTVIFADGQRTFAATSTLTYPAAPPQPVPPTGT